MGLRALPRLGVLSLLTAALGCQPPAALEPLSREEMLDPQTCQGCHPEQYRDWAGSMHAYAAEDPVFLAMNKRGQRESGGALGTFCVKCHAPMAVLEGATSDGLNLADVAPKLRGVTCFTCHATESVEGTHNNPLRQAGDGVMRGAFADALVAGRPHGATASALLDRDKLESSSLCGGCHDLVTPHGARIERTFEEWQASVFSGGGGASCGQCHMPQSPTPKPVAQVAGAPERRVHSHAFPAVDVALTPFPDKERQAREVSELLGTTLQSAVCVDPAAGGRIRVILDNVGAGHAWPSGSSQDRRAWVEVMAWSGSELVYSSGGVPAEQPVVELPDPDLWLLRKCLFTESGLPTTRFENAADFEGNELDAPVTLDPNDPRYYQGHRYRDYPAAGPLGRAVDRVTVRVRLQPVGLDVLDELIHSGDLDPAVRASMPTFDVGALLEWTPALANASYPHPVTQAPISCRTDTRLNVRAAQVPAPAKTRCTP